MKFYQIILLITFTSALTACSDKPKSENLKAEEVKPESLKSASLASEKPTGVLTDAQQRTLDKAKQTEELLNKANEERLKKIDELTSEQ